MRVKTPEMSPLLPIFVLLMIFCSSGESPADQWVKTFGGRNNDRASSVQQTSDGGYIVAGYTHSFGAGSQDVWILKLDISGNTQWQKAYGGKGNDEASSVQQTADGGYIVSGGTTSSGAGLQDILVLKLDVKGEIQWQKTYGAADYYGETSAILQAADGGYLLAGGVYPAGTGKRDVLVLRLDKDGNVQWGKSYGGNTGDDKVYSFRSTSDGKYILAGSTESYGAGKKDVWILKLDQDGDIVWQKTYGGTGDDEAYSVQETSDGGYIVAGRTDLYAYMEIEAWVLKLDIDGNIEWQRAYGSGGNDVVYAIRQTFDGNYILAGSTDSHGAGEKDAWIPRLDSSGNILWQETLGGAGDDEIFSIQQTLDEGYIAVGWSNSFGAGNDGVFALKFDHSGAISGCQITSPSYASARPTTVSGVSANATAQAFDLTSQGSTSFLSSTDAIPNSVCLVEGPDIAIDPATILFGSVVRGSSATQAITVMNVGSKDLVIGSLDISGADHLDFGIRADKCSGQTIKSLSSCNVEVVFSPSSNGNRNANLLIPSNDSDFSDFSVDLEGEGVPPILLTEPPNHASFSACSLYNLPTFKWGVVGNFKSYEIQFSRNPDFNPVGVKVKAALNTEIVIKSSTWKQVLLAPGAQGGPVYWRVVGIFTGGKLAFVSDVRSLTIEPAQPVINAQTSSASMTSLPTLSWENNCNVKFKAWFGNDPQFSKKYSISYSQKNPLEGNGKFSRQLTAQQWDSVRNLVGDSVGSTIYWKVESWDSANRESQSAAGSFVFGN